MLKIGHSITCYKDKNIISEDYKIEVWLRLICREIQGMGEISQWLREAQEYWLEHADNYANGCIDLMLDDFLTNNERINSFVDICQRVYEHLKSYGEKIPKQYLNHLCSYRESFEIMEDNLTDLYLSYGIALVRLLTGEQKKQTENA